jgi:hypothetical protein
MTQVSKRAQGLADKLAGFSIFTYYCLQTAEMAGGVGVGVEDELVDEELLVDWEVVEVEDCDDVVVLDSGNIVSVQETVDISFDVDEELDVLEFERLVLELERLELEIPVLFRLKLVEFGLVEETLELCWVVEVLEVPITVTEPGLVVVMNVEEFQEVVMLGVRVEGAVVGCVPLL